MASAFINFELRIYFLYLLLCPVVINSSKSLSSKIIYIVQLYFEAKVQKDSQIWESFRYFLPVFNNVILRTTQYDEK